jgi:hypothetical protein
VRCAKNLLGELLFTVFDFTVQADQDIVAKFFTVDGDRAEFGFVDFGFHIYGLSDSHSGSTRYCCLSSQVSGRSIAFSPDGKLLAASGSAAGNTNTIPELRLWVVDTGELVFRLDGHNAAAGKVKFSPDGSILASTSFYDSDGTVMLWDVGKGEVLATIDVPGASDVAFNPNGTLLVTAGWADGIRLWEMPPH